MVKHRRFSDKQKDDSIQKETEFQGNDIPAEKTSLDLKSLLLSGTKYAYIIGAVALLSGIFTPLTLGVEIEDVIFGMLSIFLGLAGGILALLTPCVFPMIPLTVSFFTKQSKNKANQSNEKRSRKNK